MNLLSHFYFDGIKGNPYFNFGLLFPDLVGSIDRKWKVHKVLIPSFLSWERSILTGCSKHVYRDAIFHNSPTFFKITKELRVFLEENGLEQEGTKLFFTAHICYELLLDKLIINANPTILDKFYSTLEELNLGHLHQFSKRQLGTKGEDFVPFFEKFLNGKYLYHYKTYDGIFTSVNKIHERVNQSVFNDKLSSNFNLFCSQAEQLIKNEHPNLLKSTKKIV